MFLAPTAYDTNVLRALFKPRKKAIANILSRALPYPTPARMT